MVLTQMQGRGDRRLGRSKKRMFLVVLLLLISFSACGRDETPKLPSPPAQPVTSSAGVRTSFAEVVNRVSPAVVTIRTESRSRSPRQFPFMDDPFFRRFFGDRLPTVPEQRQRGLGSGVIVSTDGYILTNHHVIDGAEEIEIEMTGRQPLDAKLVGSDPPSDLAVLKINASDLTALALADSDKVQVGDLVLAVGNPLGIGQTVTMGIISAKSRRTGLSNGSFEDFLQTDAPINRGNSGGALVDSNGNLVGINSQILSPSGGSIGIGFAIPSNMARDVLDQLLKNGEVRRGHLGIVVQPVTEDMAANLSLNNVRGLIVSQIQPGSAAERAGMKRGDVILALNGNAVSDPNSFRNDVAGTPPGNTVTLRVLREGNEQELRATLEEFKVEERPVSPVRNNSSESRGDQTGKLGLAVQPLTPAIAQQLGISAETQGLVVVEIDPAGPAADSGIQRGDVIEAVNQQPVRTVAEIRTALERSGDKPVLLLVNHKGTTIFLTIRLH
ncbi:MAG TPA: DegQ family serine endoprotease [Pyrinomonadaceae bacterium]|nr:DegQ family serine endoprotease [Pyrinomonadaceae bacterium]